MNTKTFRALVVEESGGVRRAILRDVPVTELPAGDVLVRIAYSTLNYKDGLAVTGKGKVLRSIPLAPGIDFAGTVVESASPDYRVGDKVLLTGWGVGERHWGGFSQLNRVPAEWLVPLPAKLSLKQAMALGTAGFTAMLCVWALERRGVRPGDREVLVTGAAGGVGSVAVALLARAGYRVVACTGRYEEASYLRELGATLVMNRQELLQPSRPLESERWAGAIDTVGGAILGAIFPAVAYHGVVAACGNTGGTEFTASLFPFILRGVQLIGVESVLVPAGERRAAWERLARDLTSEQIERMARVIPLAAVPEYADQITRGLVRGRLVVDVNA